MSLLNCCTLDYFRLKYFFGRCAVGRHYIALFCLYENIIYDSFFRKIHHFQCRFINDVFYQGVKNVFCYRLRIFLLHNYILEDSSVLDIVFGYRFIYLRSNMLNILDFKTFICKHRSDNS